MAAEVLNSVDDGEGATREGTAPAGWPNGGVSPGREPANAALGVLAAVVTEPVGVGGNDGHVRWGTEPTKLVSPGALLCCAVDESDGLTPARPTPGPGRAGVKRPAPGALEVPADPAEGLAVLPSRECAEETLEPVRLPVSARAGVAAAALSATHSAATTTPIHSRANTASNTRTRLIMCTPRVLTHRLPTVGHANPGWVLRRRNWAFSKNCSFTALVWRGDPLGLDRGGSAGASGILRCPHVPF